jgi:glycosyltransferase involved in cell wall biosynthesis
MLRYRNTSCCVIATTLLSEGGDWRSIYYYARSAQCAGKDVPLINPLGKRGIRQTMAAWAFAPRIIVNGLNAFDSLLVLAMCWHRKDVQVYLHETEHALDNCRSVRPLRYRLISRILSRNPVLCVSNKAAETYRERFGTKRTNVVYECPGHSPDVKLDPARIHIVNVGSLNKRKGVDLFSQVADLAKERHPDWQFHWVGGIATLDQLYQSPAVKWHGFMWNPGDVARQCRLFFLSSVDDPCPLSALEALQAGLGCVVYKETGTAEIIEGLKGSGVFQSYSPESALLEIERALDEKVDCGTQAEKLSRLIGPAAFGRAVQAAFET